jgi:hypothetical protein
MLETKDIRLLRGGIVRQTGHLYANLLTLCDTSRDIDERLKIIEVTGMTTVAIDGMARKVVEMISYEAEGIDLESGDQND